MKKVLVILMVMFSIMLVPPILQDSYAQNATTGIQAFHSDVDISPIEAVIMINEDQNKSVFFQPQIVTIRVGGEILIANNATSNHSVTSGSSPDDSMAGKIL